jgi:hypothetical protein
MSTKPVFVDNDASTPICAGYLNTVANAVWDGLGESQTRQEVLNYLDVVADVGGGVDPSAIFGRRNGQWVQITSDSGPSETEYIKQQPTGAENTIVPLNAGSAGLIITCPLDPTTDQFVVESSSETPLLRVNHSAIGVNDYSVVDVGDIDSAQGHCRLTAGVNTRIGAARAPLTGWASSAMLRVESEIAADGAAMRGMIYYPRKADSTIYRDQALELIWRAANGDSYSPLVQLRGFEGTHGMVGLIGLAAADKPGTGSTVVPHHWAIGPGELTQNAEQLWFQFSNGPIIGIRSGDEYAFKINGSTNDITLGPGGDFLGSGASSFTIRGTETSTRVFAARQRETASVRNAVLQIGTDPYNTGTGVSHYWDIRPAVVSTNDESLVVGSVLSAIPETISNLAGSNAVAVFRRRNSGGFRGLFTSSEGGTSYIGNVSTLSGAPVWTIRSDGVANNVTGTVASDVRLKEDLRPAESMLPAFAGLESKRFRYKADGAESVGFVAQDVREVFPDCVMEDDDGMLRVNETRLTRYLMAAVSELARTVHAH